MAQLDPGVNKAGGRRPDLRGILMNVSTKAVSGKREALHYTFCALSTFLGKIFIVLKS